MKRSMVAAGAALAMMASLAVACSGGDGGSKAGGDAAPITLRIGTDDEPGRPAADQIEEFARQVQTLSDGMITIEPAWNADGPAHPDWDQLVARMVVGGELDMGMIPARAWDTEGVTSLRALNAPFLITSEDLVSKVVTSDLGDQMLGGLDKAGVVGLALVPEGLRQVFSFGKPLLAPAQFDGATIRAPRSDTAFALFEALGATVGDLAGDQFSNGVYAGTVAGAESSFALAESLPEPATGTGNLVLFPKVNSLVINADKFAGLSETQQGILREAAVGTRDWAIDGMAESSEDAVAYCTKGGTVVVTSAENKAAFEKAAAPVYTELETDPLTKSLIENIRQLKTTSAEPTAVTPCAPPAAAISTSALPTSEVPTEFPEGVYRTEMDEQQLLAANVSAGTAQAADGINTLTFQDGQFLHDIKRDVPDQCHGTYTVESGRVVVRMSECGNGGRVLFSATWTFDGSMLVLDDLESETATTVFAQGLWGGRSWEKVG